MLTLTWREGLMRLQWCSVRAPSLSRFPQERRWLASRRQEVVSAPPACTSVTLCTPSTVLHLLHNIRILHHISNLMVCKYTHHHASHTLHKLQHMHTNNLHYFVGSTTILHIGILPLYYNSATTVCIYSTTTLKHHHPERHLDCIGGIYWPPPVCQFVRTIIKNCKAGRIVSCDGNNLQQILRRCNQFHNLSLNRSQWLTVWRWIWPYLDIFR